MRVLRERDRGIIILQPSNDEETTILREIIATKQPGEVLRYGGREGAEVRSPETERMTLNFYLADRKFALTATTDEDEEAIRYTRDAIFFGGEGLIFLGYGEVGGELSLEFAINHCKLCNKPVISMGECESQVCNACAEKCEHEYKRMMMHGGDFDIMGMGEACTKCGRGKPKPEGKRKKSQIERELEVQRELGVIVLYKDMPFGVGPKEVVQARRLARGLERSRTRVKRA